MIRKYRKAIIVAAILILFAVLAYARVSSSGKGGEKRPAGPGAGRKAAVKTLVVKPERIGEQILSTGTILADEEVELRSEISGKITKILFREGAPVKQGQLLVKIYDADLQAELLKAQYRKNLAQDKEYRQRMMLKKEGISQQEYDVALNELNLQDAEIQLIKVKIDKTEIRAPFSGMIGLKAVSVGSYISPNDRIATLQKLNPVKIDFNVPEKYASLVRQGAEIRFRLQNTDQLFSARVYAVEPKVAAETRTLQVRAQRANADNSIRPGSFAEVQLTLKEIENAIMIPTESLVPDFKGQKVFVYKGGRAKPVAVTTGVRRERSIQVTSGLSEGDTLIVSGVMQLKPNAPVSIKL